MKFILYGVAAIAILIGVVTIVSGFGVFQQTAGLLLLLIGTTSLGFAAVIGRLEKLARHKGSETG